MGDSAPSAAIRASHPPRWRTLAALLVSLATASVPAAWAQNGAQDASGKRELTAPLYSAEDLLFLTHMILHHEQALELAALVPSRTRREEFIRFTRHVDTAQRAEIEQMKALLQVAASRGLEIPRHDMTGDPPMAGMLSRAQMAEITAASGAEFERLWLEGMIIHHEGALDMARAQQLREFESGHRPYGLDVLVDEILVVQRAEITKMRTWLKQWNRAGKSAEGPAGTPPPRE